MPSAWPNLTWVRPLQRQLLRLALAARRAARRRRSARVSETALARWKAEHTEPGALAVMGDSLVAELPRYLLKCETPHVIVRGVPGDTIADVQARLHEVLARAPAVIVFQVGTNDVLRGARPVDVDARWRQLIERCRAALPGTAIVVLALPPITTWRVDPATVRAANEALRVTCVGAGARFVDSYGLLAAEDGTPKAGASRDGVHLTREGYDALWRLVDPLAAGDAA